MNWHGALRAELDRWHQAVQVKLLRDRDMPDDSPYMLQGRARLRAIMELQGYVRKHWPRPGEDADAYMRAMQAALLPGLSPSHYGFYMWAAKTLPCAPPQEPPPPPEPLYFA